MILTLTESGKAQPFTSSFGNSTEFKTDQADAATRISQAYVIIPACSAQDSLELRGGTVLVGRDHLPEEILEGRA